MSERVLLALTVAFSRDIPSTFAYLGDPVWVDTGV